jgi:hypothetical protein
MKDWKTTAAGILTILVGLITGVIMPFLHNAPIQTGVFLPALTAGVAGILASDSK